MKRKLFDWEKPLLPKANVGSEAHRRIMARKNKKALEARLKRKKEREQAITRVKGAK